jgi:hypothetical protein
MITLKKTFEDADAFIRETADYHTLLQSSKAIKVFEDLMLRNQELKNNTSLDLYEDFIDLQKKFTYIDKPRLRDIDNVLFMKLYRPDSKKFDDFISALTKDEQKYYNQMQSFVLGNNPKKQSINELFQKLQIDLSPLLT